MPTPVATRADLTSSVERLRLAHIIRLAVGLLEETGDRTTAAVKLPRERVATALERWERESFELKNMTSMRKNRQFFRRDSS